MILTVKEAVEGTDGNIRLIETNSEVRVSREAIMAIDGSTNVTGVSIVDYLDEELKYSLAFKRNKKEESAVAYKVRMKKEIKQILLNNPAIINVVYEEPYIGYAGSTKSLMMLRTFIEEIIAEEEPKLNYVKYHELNNKRWKKLFLHPEKCPNNSKLEKKIVYDKLISLYPYCKVLSQDEIDSSAIGIVGTRIIKNGGKVSSKKKAKKFEFNSVFIGCYDDEDLIQSLQDYEVPREVIENGITIETLGNRANFEKAIYESMGEDDKLLVIKFDSRYHGDVVLKYKLGKIIIMYDYIYALIWRKRRRKTG